MKTSDHDMLNETHLLMKTLQNDVHNLTIDVKTLLANINALNTKVALLEQYNESIKMDKNIRDKATKNMIAIIAIVAAVISSLVSLIVQIILTKVK